MQKAFFLLLLFFSHVLFAADQPSLIGEVLKKNLIEKGYEVLHSIRHNLEYQHKIEFFIEDAVQYNPFFLKNVPTAQKSIKNVVKHIGLGEWSSLLFSSHQDDDLICNQRKAYLESIICVMWAIWDYTIKMDQEFISGSYSVIDDEKKLFSFFSHYASLFGYAQLSDLSYGPYVAANMIGDPRSAFIYNRQPDGWGVPGSSHYMNQSRVQIGIDIRFSESGYALPLLPYGMTTLMIGDILPNLEGFSGKTFLKWEPYGAGDLSSAVYHSFEYVQSCFSRKNKRSEKDIPPFISAALKDFQSVSNLETKKELGFYIKYAVDTVSEFSTVSDRLKASAENFLLAIKDQYGVREVRSTVSLQQKTVWIVNDLAFYRAGHEVVIDFDELIGS